ncbi:hypothetical protein Slin15195_G026070 [Septoria linicola]|uniref:Uncharacterized protein n=1 Tax=Septoria linicola TaxID=215465 RepID=A0A9Q9ANE3_9PEZI|nr:hypothetical protein Slin15195_G026070 [Septoria linicola]
MQVILDTSSSTQDTFIVVPDYLAAVADPMLFSAWLFVKFRPWGKGHRWLDPHNQPDPSTPISIEVLELRGLVYRNILKTLEIGQADHDTTLADAIATLMVFTCMTEGWEAAKTHVQGFVRLVAIQLKLTGGSPKWFSNITSLEAFNTALFRDVPGTVVATCAKILAMFLRMIRQAAVDIIQMPLELADKNVWTRVKYLQGIDWYNWYESSLIPIAGLASTIPREASRIESSSGRARHLSQASLSGTMTYV